MKIIFILTCVIVFGTSAFAQTTDTNTLLLTKGKYEVSLTLQIVDTTIREMDRCYEENYFDTTVSHLYQVKNPQFIRLQLPEVISMIIEPPYINECNEEVFEKEGDTLFMSSKINHSDRHFGTVSERSLAQFLNAPFQLKQGDKELNMSALFFEFPGIEIGNASLFRSGQLSEEWKNKVNNLPVESWLFLTAIYFEDTTGNECVWRGHLSWKIRRD
jgi:hypothetical protein